MLSKKAHIGLLTLLFSATGIFCSQDPNQKYSPGEYATMQVIEKTFDLAAKLALGQVEYYRKQDAEQAQKDLLEAQREHQESIAFHQETEALKNLCMPFVSDRCKALREEYLKIFDEKIKKHSSKMNANTKKTT